MTPELGRLTREDVTDEARECSAIAAAAAADKNGMETIVLEVGEIISITEEFVLTSGHNVRQVRSIAEEVERQVKEHSGRRPRLVEGLGDATWVLLDYGDFVVHVFLDETRRHYGLERLWADAPRVDWERLAGVAAAGG